MLGYLWLHQVQLHVSVGIADFFAFHSAVIILTYITLFSCSTVIALDLGTLLPSSYRSFTSKVDLL